MKLLLLLLSAVAAAHGYNILCIHTVPSKSHFQLMKGIVDPLVKAGHQVTMMTTFPDTTSQKNLKYVDVSNIMKVMPTNVNMMDRGSQDMSLVMAMARNISRLAIETPAVREMLVKEQFDAVVSEWFFSDVDSGYAAVQEVPWILLSGMVMHTHIEHLVDAVRSVPTIPALMNDAGIPMDFYARLKNTFAYLFMTFATLKDYPMVKSNYDAYFTPIAKARGVTLQPFDEAVHNISILFVNSHPSFAPAHSLPPNVIEIAGYHIPEDTPPLPEDLQLLLDSSSRGVIYFSMGSVLKSTQLPEKVKKDIISIFADLPYTVLWKFEDKLDNLPKNVHIRPWFPQTSVLAHNNVKVFITHGGLLSTLESLKFGVPVIAIPVFGDQPSNAMRCVREGHALMVTFSSDMGEELRAALNEMLGNDKYYKRAKYLSKLFQSRPVTPTKLIQHYVELAIESKGAHHLRSKSLLYSWYQLWMLDQIGLLLLILYIIYRVFKIIGSFFKKENVKKKQKRN
ncbi:UDP-glucosyltransferase 2-like [Melitaea cinxia]|uniref:UDP-glucosyltransferase 2-like n=1 Tax=Melitaea cinxia TaxID=113334 RepID=UPI001E26E9A7|nr:UDP-glucosyltransferase 2-like [Melitaea cinxia]